MTTLTAALPFLLAGLVLCFLGARSMKLAVPLAGFGCGWLLSETSDASLTTGFIVSLAAALAAYLMAMLLSRFLLLIAGGIVGAVIGAKLFVVLDGDSWALAVIAVPCIAVVGALLAEWQHRRFLVWSTALAGAALVLSGIARLWPDSAHHLRHPDRTVGAVVLVVAWAALAWWGHAVQLHGSRRDAVSRSG
ncbi:TM7S3/TM198-like domain-containing protein [Luteipulveratus flavus]|uniref:DUF4203 domain-containing protein n=1 Tax=Luteipulveratus flavus TaxID=3031728 RepID=A0ABT6C303_9MICO|nr:DUF4203 domain-containing protein [Luteipulveratus sp. YIM 133296]MDF8262692.1 DUF4203 domain-containing protein [Luteipulveratus sp. YIM 133296]